MSFQEEVSRNLHKLVSIQRVLSKRTTESDNIRQGTHIPIFEVATRELGYIRVGDVLDEVIAFLESYE
tara:strand:+ start:2093 stop:2296 length:204 start_codon:yes stop_codon:yes gene_type:complete